MNISTLLAASALISAMALSSGHSFADDETPSWDRTITHIDRERIFEVSDDTKEIPVILTKAGWASTVMITDDYGDPLKIESLESGSDDFQATLAGDSRVLLKANTYASETNINIKVGYFNKPFTIVVKSTPDWVYALSTVKVTR